MGFYHMTTDTLRVARIQLYLPIGGLKTVAMAASVYDFNFEGCMFECLDTPSNQNFEYTTLLSAINRHPVPAVPAPPRRPVSGLHLLVAMI